MGDALPDVTRSGNDLIDMVFRKSRVEDRKNWLNAIDKDAYLDYSEAAANGGVKYSEFINKEYILFSKYDNERSIPHIIDGFKPSQRKVLFGCFKRNLKGEVKVAQLTGYIAEQSAYHHGEQSLQGTIVNMAQSFVGSNNVNLLTPSGQFGTRLMGGKDSASPRYIFTKLEPITRTIFHPDDDELLTYLNDDGLSIEPEFYVPVIPMILVNGADGIGTGWSTTIPNYNPRDIISNLRRLIVGEEPEAMVPFYCGYTGKITPKNKGSFDVQGKIERIDDTKLLITELPIKKWTQDYKQFIEGMLTGDGKSPPEIKDFKENHTDTTVSFTITAEKEKIDQFEKEKNGLYGKFKLTGSLSTTNMHLFNTEAKITKYDDPLEIMSAFYTLRIEYYNKRKENLVGKLEAEQKMLSNKARFIEEVCSGDLVVNNRKRSDILADLQARGYDTNTKYAANKNGEESQDEDADESATDAELAKGYEYLLGMKIWSLTYEKAQALRNLLEQKTQELEILKEMAPTQIWLNDLDAIEAALDERDAEIASAFATEKKAQQKSQKRQAKNMKMKTVASRKTKKKKDEWDSEMETSSDEDDGSEDFFASSKPKPVSRSKPKAAKVPAAKAAAKPVEKATKAPIVQPKQVPPKPAAAVPKPANSDREDDSVDSDGIDESLMERMKRKLVVSPPTEKAVSRIDQQKKKKKPSPRMFDSDEEMENGENSDSLTKLDSSKFAKASLTPATKKKGGKSTGPLKRVTNTTGTTAPKVKAAKTKAATKKKKVLYDSDESEGSDTFAFDDDSELSDSESPVVKKAAPSRSRRARTAQPVSYAFEDSDDESL